MDNKTVDCSTLPDEEQQLDPTLKSLVNSSTTNWIFVGGKGGVGKTTTSCSLAIQLAARRDSVLILSTDPAHNVSDAFGQAFSNTHQLVKGFSNLYAMEIDSSMKINTGYQIEEKDELGLLKMLPELVQSFPGVDEALSFLLLMQAVQSMNFSCIVFDTAPTGHTLRLLSFPDILENVFKKLSELQDTMAGPLNLISSMTGGGGEDSGMFAQLENTRALTLSVRKMFRDPSKTTFVCVCIPEFLSLYETERLVQQLAKQEIDARYIVVNQILYPVEGYEDGKPSSTFKALEDKAEFKEILGEYKKLENKATKLEQSHNCRRRMQSRYLSQMRDLYCYDFHVVPMPLQSDEVRGVELLKQFGRLLLEQKPMPILEENF